jgi:transposase
LIALMGPRQEAQSAFFYGFSIKDHVPEDHVLRAIEGVIDLSSVRTHLTAFYSSTGRPSVGPELMMRMLLVGYIMGIRSERRLCEEVHLNLAYRWFCKMDLSDPIPDHSTFSKNRHGRFRDSDVLRHVFEVERWKIWLAAVWQLKIPSLKMNKMGYAAQFLCKIYQIFYQK